MTNILSIIFGNLSAGPETRRFPERVAPEGRFRGTVLINDQRCIACGICDQVCVSGAIELRDFAEHAEWNYDPGRCTFCARCVMDCPVGALKQETDRPALYVDSGELAVKHTVAYPICESCGAIAVPVRGPKGRLLPPRSVAEIREQAKLCAKCRLAPPEKAAPAERPAEPPTAKKPDGEEAPDGR